MRPKSFRYQQIAILRTCAHGRAFMCSTPGQYQSALKLHAKGLLDRDLGPNMSRRFIGNARGTDWIIAHDAQLAEAA